MEEEIEELKLACRKLRRTDTPNYAGIEYGSMLPKSQDALVRGTGMGAWYGT